MNSIRYIILLTSIFLTLIFLTGCWNSNELNQLAIVTGGGIDKADDNRIRFTVQIHVPSSKKDSNESLGSPSILWADGVNTADALSKLQIKSPRKLFFGQMHVFIINEKFAKENGVRDQLDFLARVPDIRLRNKLFISEDSVDQILSSKTELEKSSVETLSGISKKLVVPAIDLNYFLQMQEDKGQSAVIPKIRMMESDQKASNSMTPAIVGTSILKKDRIVGEIDVETTRGLMWFRNKIENPMITIVLDDEKGSVSFKTLHARTELLPRIENGEWKMTVKTLSSVDVVQNATNLQIPKPDVTEMLEKKLNEDLQKRLKQVVQQVQQKFKTDVLGYAEAIYRKYPKQWYAKKDHWDEIFPEIETEYDLNVKILKPGEYVRQRQ